MKRKTSIAILFLVILSVSANAQRRKVSKPWGYGAGVIYNFQAESFGAEVRMRIPVTGKLYAVPEVSYYPSFNRYHDLFAGGALQYDLFAIRSYNFYPLAGVYYHNWLNVDEYAPGQRKKHNLSPQAGVGLVRNRGCWRPFIEDRYDFKWKEDHLRIGIYYYPGQCGKSRSKEKCPSVKGT
ncbi:MAG: hypothetical protein JSS90_05470 [Bacteroidetes bacterium]|nr:hypothetical protein [Bacteroidota bacterium]